MARVEGQEPGPGQKSKANGPRRLTPATEDTDISYWISLELGTVWEMYWIFGHPLKNGNSTGSVKLKFEQYYKNF